MSISKLKLAWKYLTGGIGGVADYLLDLLNAALAKIDPANKAKIQAAFNIAQKVLNTLAVLSWLCPTKWQTAYSKTVDGMNAYTSFMLANELSDSHPMFNPLLSEAKEVLGVDDATVEAILSQCGM